MRSLRHLLSGSAIAAVALVVAATAPAAPTITPVMTGLDAPRGLDFGFGGSLYVAEAGRGGSGPCVVLRGAPQCYGPSGAISRLRRGQQERIVTGLPSTISPDGEVTGPHDVSFAPLGLGYATIGFGSDPALRSQFGPAGRSFGSLVLFGPSGGWWLPVADIAAVEAAQNPAGPPVDSNPYGLEATSTGALVADAGANAIVDIRLFGPDRVVATLRSRPSSPTDSVPTEVIGGARRTLFASELTGFPFADGSAAILKIEDGDVSVYAGGFKTIIDFAFGHDGSLYVLQYATGPFLSGTGALIRVAPDGTRSTITNQLFQPASILIGHDGSLYVSNRGSSVGTGEVLRIQP